MKIIIKNNKTGKHYKIEMGGKVKVGDKIMRLNEHEYLYNGKFEYCVVVKVLGAKKEVKKLSKPYLETKVVKVKKKRVLNMNPRRAGKFTKYWSSLSNEVLERLAINTKRELERRKVVKEEPKGNWVNDENLDKIKFPCFCSYVDGSVKKIGMFNKVFFRGEYFYLITDCLQQYKDANGEQFYHPSNLKKMFEDCKIHILKGKIIIYEEE